MANWIRVIYFAFVLAWVIYALIAVAVEHEPSPRRFGQSVAVTVIIGLFGFAICR